MTAATINYVQLGTWCAIVLVLIYVLFRFFTDKDIVIGNVVKSFAFGFSLSFVFNVAVTGYYEICDEIEKLGNACLLLGAFALIAFTVDNYLKMLTREEEG